MQLPTDDQIHLCIVDDVPLSSQRYNHLSDDEKAHYARITSAKIQQQFLQTRSALRQALTAYCPDINPAQWQFVRNAYGRPALQMPSFDIPIDFNLSHTRGVIVIAFVARAAMGVDVEYSQRECRALAVAQRFFSPQEVRDLRRLEPDKQRQRFFELWTLKEAYIKACGMGLAIPLSSFSFQFAPERTTIAFDERRQDDPQAWQFWHWQLSAQHRVAIACKREVGEPERHIVGYRLNAKGLMQAQPWAPRIAN